MLVDITIIFEGKSSIISFDSLPTFLQLKKAVAADIVGADDFTMTGITARGSQVIVKDATSLTRALGPRQEMEIRVAESLHVDPNNRVTDRKPSQTAGGGSSSQLLNVPGAARSASATRNSIRRSASPSGGRASFTKGATNSDLACNCETVLSVDADTVVMLPVEQHLWVAERNNQGAIAVRNGQTAELMARIKPLEGDSASGSSLVCQALLHVPQTKHVWAGYNSKRIVVVDVRTLAPVKILLEHSGAVTTLCYSSGFVFSASLDFTILQWNPDSKSVVKLLAKHTNSVRSLVSHGSKLISGSDDRSLLVWNAATGEPQRQLQGAHSTGVRCIEIYDGKEIWSGAEDGAVRCWGFDNFKLQAEFHEHSGPVLSLKRLQTRVISVGGDRKMVMYDAGGHTCLGPILHPHESVLNSLAVMGVRQTFSFWTGGMEPKLCRWALEEGTGMANAGMLRLRSTSPEAPPEPTVETREAGNAPPTPQPQPVQGPSFETLALRLTLEETSDRELQQAVHAKNHAELMLMEHIQRTQRSAKPQLDLENVGPIFLESHGAYQAVLLEHHRAFTMHCSHLLQGTADSITASEKTREKAQEDARRIEEDSERTLTMLRSQLASSHEELRELHEQFDAVSHQNEKRKLDLQTSENTRKNMEASLTHYLEENRNLAKRKGELEQELTEANNERETIRRGSEKEMRDRATKDADEKERLTAELLEKSDKLDDLERTHRTKVRDLQAELEKAETGQRKAEFSLRESKLEEERLSKELQQDRDTFSAMLRESDENYAKLKDGKGRDVDDARGALEKMQRDLRDSQFRVNTLEDENSTLQRRLNLQATEGDDDTKRLAQQLEEARLGWRTEVEMLEQSLSDKIQQTSAAEAKSRDAATAMLRLQSTNDNQTRTIANLQAETDRLRESMASLKGEVLDLQSNLKNERTARVEAERNLGEAEDNYEQLRRRHVDEVQTLKQELTREIQEERLKNANLEETNVSLCMDLETQLTNKSRQLDQTECSMKQHQVEVLRLKEELDYQTRKNTSLLEDGNSTQFQSQEEIAALKRSLEARRLELDALTGRLKNDMERDIVATDKKNKEFAEMHDQLRDSERKNAVLTSENETLHRKFDESQEENNRSLDRLNAEKKAHEETRMESTATTEQLRQELSAARARVQETTLNSEALVRDIEELQSLVGSARQDSERNTTRANAQIRDREIQLDDLTKAKRIAELDREKVEAALREMDRDWREKWDKKATENELLVKENRDLSEAVAHTKQRSDNASQKGAALLGEKHAAMEKLKSESDAEVATLQTKISQLEQQLLEVDQNRKLSELERDAEAESHNRTKTLHQDDMGTMKQRLSEKENQLKQREAEYQKESLQRSNQLLEERQAAEKKLAEVQGQATIKQEKDAQFQEGNRQEQRRLEEKIKELEGQLFNEKEERYRQQREGALSVAEIEAKNQLLEKDLVKERSVSKQRQEEVERLTVKYKAQLADNSSEHSKKDTQNEELLAKCRTLESEVSLQQLELEREKHRVEDLKREAQRSSERAEGDRTRLLSSSSDMSRMMEGVRLENASLKDELEHCQREVRMRDENSGQLGERVKAYEGEQRNLHDRIKSLMASESMLQQQVREKDELYRISTTTERQKADDLERDKTRELRRSDELTAENATLKQELDGTGERTRLLKDQHAKEIDRYAVEIRQVQLEVQQLRQELGANQRTHEDQLTQARKEQERAQEERLRAQREIDVNSHLGGMRVQQLEEEMAHAVRTRDEALSSQAKLIDQLALNTDELHLERKKSQGAEAMARFTLTVSEGLIASALGEASSSTLMHPYGLNASSNSRASARRDGEVDTGDVAELVHQKALLLADSSLGITSELAKDLSRAAQGTDTRRWRQEAQDWAEKYHSTKAEFTHQQRINDQNLDLLVEVRGELQDLYGRYKGECVDHDTTKVELMKEKGSTAKRRALEDTVGSSAGGNLVLEVHHREELGRLKEIIVTLEKEKESLQRRLTLLTGTSARSPSPAFPGDDGPVVMERTLGGGGASTSGRLPVSTSSRRY